MLTCVKHSNSSTRPFTGPPGPYLAPCLNASRSLEIRTYHLGLPYANPSYYLKTHYHSTLESVSMRHLC